MSGYLDATPCYAFKDEKLNYFFYSKAEYRHKFGNDSDSNINDLYVTFIFSDNVVSPYRIFPFDTGAWAAGLYNNIFKRDFEIEKDKFQITNNYESLVKYIKIVWGNNENYLNENSLSEFDESNYACFKDVIGILASKTENVDNRKRTPEISSNSGILINNETVRLIVLHKSALMTDGQSIKKECEKRGIRYIHYSHNKTNEYGAPNIFLGCIQERLYDFLIAEGIINEEN